MSSGWGLVVVLQTEVVDVRDVGIAGEMVAHCHSGLSLISVNTGVEATQTPAVPTSNFNFLSTKLKPKILPENSENCSTDELSQRET